MNPLLKIGLLSAWLFLLPAILHAEELPPQRAAVTADFEKFARKKIGELNRNLAFTRKRMQIRKETDGSYRAVFHEIDEASINYEVVRSESKAGTYVATLTYRELVYDVLCPTPAQCRQETFLPMGYIPNRQIFIYSKGRWR